MPDHRRPAPHLRTLLALACLSPAAMAETSPWYLGVAQSLSYESNLYRVDSGVQLPAGYNRSDAISNTSLVAGIDQPIGRQRVFGTAKLGVNRYSNNDYLNDNSYNVTAGLDWATVENISGNLGLTASRNQRRFNVDTAPGQPVETRKNNESVEQLDATVRVGVVTRLTMEATLGLRNVSYSAPEFAGSQYQQPRISLGVRYRPGIATFGASLGLANSDYDATPTQQVNGQNGEQVRRTSLDLTAYWPANGVSSLYARLSPTRVTYDQFTQRDFSGLTGALKWTWLPTGKLEVDTRLVHDIGQDSNFETFGGPVVVGTNNTGRTTTELRVNAAYELTAKVALTAALGTAHRSLEQTLNVGNQSEVLRTGSDNTATLSIGGRWTPLRSVMVGCDLARDQRAASGGLTQDYRANTVSCYGQFTVQ